MKMDALFNNSSQAVQLEILKMKIYQCHTENITHSQILNKTEFDENGVSNGTFCPKVFDGLLCWDDTPAGAVAYQKCPKNIYGWSPNLLAYKKCAETGIWFEHPGTNKPWTNYTTCVDLADMTFREALLTASVVCYSISFVLLCVSMGILHSYKLLNTTRTKVHMQMFLALALNSLSWIAWYIFVVRDVDMLTMNPQLCRILSMLNIYLMCTSYMWMFCEGLNLHLSLVVVFVNQAYIMKIFLLIGWILPLTLTVFYYICRVFLGDVERCMIDESAAFFIITIPVAITMFLSLYFLVRIMMVLVNKARNQPGAGGIVPVSGPTARLEFSKTIKPVLLLIPLFGLYFLLMPVHPPLGTPFEVVYSVIITILTGLQGAIVSVLFCFNNHEVINQIKQDRERRRRIQFELNQITAATEGHSGNYADRRV